MGRWNVNSIRLKTRASKDERIHLNSNACHLEEYALSHVQQKVA